MSELNNKISPFCQKFLSDPTKNPQSGKPITEHGQIYKKWVKACGSPIPLPQTPSKIQSPKITSTVPTPKKTTSKPTPKKTTPKATPKVSTPKKTTPKATPKVSTPKKTTSKPTPKVSTPKKTTPKPTPKVPTPKKTTSKPTPKVSTPKKTTSKPTPKVSTPKKTTSKPTPKVSTPKKTTSKATPKVSTPKKTTSRVTPKVSTPKKTTPKATPKVYTPKKATSKTTTPKIISKVTTQQITTPTIASKKKTSKTTTPTSSTSSTTPTAIPTIIKRTRPVIKEKILEPLHVEYWIGGSDSERDIIVDGKAIGDDVVYPIISTWGSLFRIATIGDGHCFIHAVLKAYNKDYQNNENAKYRIDEAIKLRRDLASNLSLPNPAYPPYNYWQTSNRGGFIRLTIQEINNPEYLSVIGIDYTLNGLKHLFNSNQFLGDEVYDYIANLLNIDIYIMRYGKINGVKDLIPHYFTHHRQPRPYAIFIVGNTNHYEVLCIDTDQGYQTIFERSHPLLKIAIRKFMDIGYNINDDDIYQPDIKFIEDVISGFQTEIYKYIKTPANMRIIFSKSKAIQRDPFIDMLDMLTPQIVVQASQRYQIVDGTYTIFNIIENTLLNDDEVGLLNKYRKAFGSSRRKFLNLQWDDIKNILAGGYNSNQIASIERVIGKYTNVIASVGEEHYFTAIINILALQLPPVADYIYNNFLNKQISADRMLEVVYKANAQKKINAKDVKKITDIINDEYLA